MSNISHIFPFLVVLFLVGLTVWRWVPHAITLDCLSFLGMLAALFCVALLASMRYKRW